MYIYPFNLTWNLREKRILTCIRALFKVDTQLFSTDRDSIPVGCDFTAVKLPEGRRDHHGRAKTFPTCRTSTPCPAHGVHFLRPRHYHLQKHFDLTTIN